MKMYILSGFIVFIFGFQAQADYSKSIQGKVRKVTEKTVHIVSGGKTYILNKSQLTSGETRRMSKRILIPDIYHIPLRSISSVQPIKKNKVRKNEKK